MIMCIIVVVITILITIIITILGVVVVVGVVVVELSSTRLDHQEIVENLTLYIQGRTFRVEHSG